MRFFANPKTLRGFYLFAIAHFLLGVFMFSLGALFLLDTILNNPGYRALIPYWLQSFIFHC